jgi:hypothetical protein
VLENDGLTVSAIRAGMSLPYATSEPRRNCDMLELERLRTHGAFRGANRVALSHGMNNGEEGDEEG